MPKGSTCTGPVAEATHYTTRDSRGPDAAGCALHWPVIPAFLLMPYAHPIITAMDAAHARILALRKRAASFCVEVMLSQHACPGCGGSLRSIGASKAACDTCGHFLDPTLTFQRSPCCNAGLRFARRHYLCSRCHAIVRSHFLAEEVLFDARYFAQAMHQSRERKRQRREVLRAMLAENRSAVTPSALPEKDIPELFQALDVFVQADSPSEKVHPVADIFRMESYRQHILSILPGCVVRFSAFQPLHDDARLDRVRRFTTLIHMEHQREVWLQETTNDILVMDYEAHA